MRTASNLSPVPAPVVPPSRRPRARQLYHALIGERGSGPGRIDELARSSSRSFLVGALDDAAGLTCDFPADLRALPTWLESGHAETARCYRQYLDERRQGAPRRFFGSRSHALHFLRSVAPTKLVDGAWLYGLLERWNDPRLAPLIRIYLEELGDGRPAQHHVLLYRQLLRQHDCEDWHSLGDEHHVQGALQLALAHHAGELLPEVIGFNLGYEQLPLHLPITAYELNELDIDPYYFTLHVTIDNASTGHARKSLDCLLECMPHVGDGQEFARRVANGYKLNLLGFGTNEAIASFDLERELLAVFTDKASIGAPLHSDYCRVGGRTVSDWLGEPGQLPAFLTCLQGAGWIKRGQAAEDSRFWRLLHDDGAPMFGVFSTYEQQLVRDWIEGDSAAAGDGSGAARLRPSPARFRPRGASQTASPARELSQRPMASVAQIVSHQLDPLLADANTTHDDELNTLADRLAAVTGKSEAMSVLIGFMSPANHSYPAGLAATRIYAGLFGGYAG